MKKKLFGGIAVVVIAAAMVLNVNFSAKNNDLSAISLANVEALTIGECIAVALCDVDPNYWCCEPGDGWKYRAGSCWCF